MNEVSNMIHLTLCHIKDDSVGIMLVTPKTLALQGMQVTSKGNIFEKKFLFSNFHFSFKMCSGVL